MKKITYSLMTLLWISRESIEVINLQLPFYSSGGENKKLVVYLQIALKTKAYCMPIIPECKDQTKEPPSPHNFIYLCRPLLRNLATNTPHFLELHPELVKRLSDNSNEDVLHQPRQEKNHGGEEEGRAPCWQGVNGTVHDDHPAFLRWGLIYREDACG